MNKKLVIILLLLSITVNEVTSEVLHFFNDLQLVLNFEGQLHDTVKTIIEEHKDVINDIISIGTEVLPGDSKIDVYRESPGQLTNLSDQLEYMMTRMEMKFGLMESTISQIPQTVEIDIMTREVASAISRIKNFYHDALVHSRQLHEYNNIELQHLANTLTGKGSNDLIGGILTLYNYLVPSFAEHVKPNFLDLFFNEIKGRQMELCGGEQSANQYLYNLYTNVVTTELMGLIALSFGYQLQQKLNDVTIAFELEQAQVDRKERLTQYFHRFREVIGQAPINLRPCDPPHLIRDETFYEMEKLYQALYIQSYDLRSDFCRGGCYGIDRYDFNTSEGVCSRLYDCQDIQPLSYCTMPNSLRRYEWMVDNYGNLYGQSSEKCPGASYDVYDPGREWLFPCATCVCTCEGNDKVYTGLNGIHAFSLIPSRSQINENMVITGVKFHRRKSIICIKIKQGKLLPGGQIQENSKFWSECDINELEYFYARQENLSSYKNQREYVVIDWTTNFIDLDDLIAPSGHVITGIKFFLYDKSVYYSAKKHIQLQVEYALFNVSSGQLMHESTWMSSSVDHRELLSVQGTDSPLNQKEPRDQSIPHLTPKHFIKFGCSSLRKDVGQTTLPLLDAQAVESKPGQPLTGVGLFHKGLPGYGGFLAFRVFSLNYTEYMRNSRIEIKLDSVKSDENQEDGLKVNKSSSTLLDANIYISEFNFKFFLVYVGVFVVLSIGAIIYPCCEQCMK